MSSYELSVKEPSYEAFNSLLSELSEDLSATFHDYQGIQVCSANVNAIISADKSTPLLVTLFHAFLGKQADRIAAKDVGVFDVLSPVFSLAKQLTGGDFDLSGEYVHADDDTKSAIWEYVQKLHEISSCLFVAGKVVSIDIESMDSVVESFAAIDQGRAEVLTNSLMSLVPQEIRSLVEDKVSGCQAKIESGEMTQSDIFEQMTTALSMFM